MTSVKKIGLVAVVLLVLLGLSAIAAVISVRSPSIRGVVIDRALRQFITPSATSTEAGFFENLLGFKTPRTYLVLFLNNTELRPGGGFIGAYAVVSVDKGLPHVNIVSGSEVVDNAAPGAYLPPPEALRKYLNVDKWQFRDSNWSPDFAQSASTSLALYRLENGPNAAAIDGIIGVTPVILEKILAVTGPITVDDREFTAVNVVEKLEYEVEYGYKQRGQDFSERKQILTHLVQAVTTRMIAGVALHWSENSAIGLDLLNEKQVVLFSLNPLEQSAFVSKDWAGVMVGSPGDYIMWADANLGALKTDVVIERALSYAFSPTATGFRATVTMDYTNKGSFTWRTSRYRDYARVFVPLGSTLFSSSGAMDNDRSGKSGIVDQGVENGRQWFGAFLAVEPGKTGRLTFTYDLPPSVTDSVRLGQYQLLAQKQIGTIAPKLTLHLDFGKQLQKAYPGEDVAKHGDALYELKTDLRIDREFSVTL